MPSFDIQYDEDEDTLEVRFAPYEVSRSRTISLNDSILLHTDRYVESAYGLTFYSFSRLVLVSETQFTSLQETTEWEAASVLALLSLGPAGQFFVITDPEAFIARVRGPSIESLVQPE